MERETICAWCGKPVTRTQATGRPKKYCREACSHAAKRARKRDEYDQLASAATIAAEPGDPVCRVCGANPATVGHGATRILCVICSGTNPGQSAGP